MKTLFNRLTGFLLILAALIGLIFSLGGIFALQRVKPTLTSSLIDVVRLIGTTLETTGQGLEVTQQSLKSSIDSISALQTTIESTAQTLGSTQPVLSDITNLLKEDLPETIQATQQSLTTAQESAAVIDSVLLTFSKIPLIGVPYQPSVPLPQALGEVAQSLEGLPEKFIAMTENLENTGDNLAVVEADLKTVAVTVSQIQNSVSEYDTVLKNYQNSVAQVKVQLDALVESMPRLVNLLVLALTIFLAWMAIANLGLLTQGWELMHRPGRPLSAEVAAAPAASEQPAEPSPAEVPQPTADEKTAD